MVKRRWPKGTWMKLTSGKILRGLMDQRGVSNADVARAAGCQRTFISALVTGRKNSCRPETAERIAQFFAVPLEILFVPSVSAASGRDIKTQGRNAA